MPTLITHPRLVAGTLAIAIGVTSGFTLVSQQQGNAAIRTAESAARAADDSAAPARKKNQEIRAYKARVKAHSNPSKPNVLANKTFPLQPIDFAPSVVNHPSGAIVAAPAAADFDRMFAAATTAGVPLRVTSSYRTYASQVATYNHWVATSGTAMADRYSAKPGYSEHQTGFAVDFAAGGCALECFTDTPQRAWLVANAAEYGFIERYPEGKESITGYGYESWHYRYVGTREAKTMKKRGFTTLEEFWNLPGGNG